MPSGFDMFSPPITQLDVQTPTDSQSARQVTFGDFKADIDDIEG